MQQRPVDRIKDPIYPFLDRSFIHSGLLCADVGSKSVQVMPSDLVILLFKFRAEIIEALSICAAVNHINDPSFCDAFLRGRFVSSDVVCGL